MHEGHCGHLHIIDDGHNGTGFRRQTETDILSSRRPKTQIDHDEPLQNHLDEDPPYGQINNYLCSSGCPQQSNLPYVQLRKASQITS